MEKAQHYTFGDSDLAAQRLERLARVFEPGSRALLERFARVDGALALDLGSGPGFTTRLVAEHVRTERVTGLEQSPKLLEQARRVHGSERVSFAPADVSVPPFPTPPAALIYSRFLLTHLRNPEAVIRSWASAAEPGALLILEETAELTGKHPAFPRYYALVERMQQHYGQRMYIGRELAALAECPEWSLVSAEIPVFPLPAADMARLHFLNVGTWSKDPFARDNYREAELSELAAELERIATGEVSAPPVSCAMGQVVLRRA
jgi:ubiquinone/menaquinone biosynthesis C-methylase UbiE